MKDLGEGCGWGRVRNRGKWEGGRRGEGGRGEGGEIEK
jgi:hypothetical protein